MEGTTIIAKHMVTTVLQELLSSVKKLETHYSKHNKKFTLDGRLVGDIGEILCSETYDISLFTSVKPDHDASYKKKGVQIKSTMKSNIGFPTKKIPDYFLAIKINEDGTFKELYNGPGIFLHDKMNIGKRKTTERLCVLSVNQLIELNKIVPKRYKIPKKVNAS